MHGSDSVERSVGQVDVPGRGVVPLPVRFDVDPVQERPLFPLVGEMRQDGPGDLPRSVHPPVVEVDADEGRIAVPVEVEQPCDVSPGDHRRDGHSDPGVPVDPAVLGLEHPPDERVVDVEHPGAVCGSFEIQDGHEVDVVVRPRQERVDEIVVSILQSLAFAEPDPDGHDVDQSPVQVP